MRTHLHVPRCSRPVEASCQRVPGRLSRCKRGRRARVAAPPPGRADAPGRGPTRPAICAEGPEANAERLKPAQLSLNSQQRFILLSQRI